PAGDNALDRYRQVLQLDPGNAVALEGIEAIVLRYVDLADAAMRQGQYDQAETLLGRAASLNPARAELLAARERLTVARQTKVQRFDLDPKGLEGESLEVMVQLAEIARQIQRNESTFLINARTDAEGRWIYKVMREAVGGYRLRGNIDISSTPGILVMQPPGCADLISQPAMKRLPRRLLCAALTSSPLVFSALLQAGPVLEIESGYVRGLPPGTQNTAAYMTLRNSGEVDVELVSASS